MGGMGGGLCFLNKKPWHPGSIKNMEKVSKREAEAKASKKKREEKIKELKKDRELEEMLNLNDKLESRSTRNMSLDWMYKGEITAKAKLTNCNKKASKVDKENFTSKKSLNNRCARKVQDDWVKLNQDPVNTIKIVQASRREISRTSSKFKNGD